MQACVDFMHEIIVWTVIIRLVIATLMGGIIDASAAPRATRICVLIPAARPCLNLSIPMIPPIIKQRTSLIATVQMLNERKNSIISPIVISFHNKVYEKSSFADTVAHKIHG